MPLDEGKIHQGIHSVSAYAGPRNQANPRISFLKVKVSMHRGRDARLEETHALRLTALSPPVVACSRSNGEIPILPLHQRCPKARTESLDLRALPFLTQYIRLKAATMERTLPYPSGKVGRREALFEERFLVANVFDRLRCKGYGWDVEYCRRSGAFVLRFHRVYHIYGVFSMILHSRQHSTCRVEGEELRNIPQCQNTWSPGTTFGTLTIVLSNCRCGWVSSFNSCPLDLGAPGNLVLSKSRSQFLLSRYASLDPASCLDWRGANNGRSIT